MTDQVVLKDFTPARRERKFTHGGETYELVATVPLEMFPTFILMGQQLSDLDVNDMKGTLEELKNSFELLLTSESAGRFIKRLSNRDNPIGVEAIEIFTWAIGELTNRPTEQSSSSSNGSVSDTSGSGSTAGAPDSTSTP